MICQILADSINTGYGSASHAKYRCEQYYKLMVLYYSVMCFKILETASRVDSQWMQF